MDSTCVSQQLYLIAVPSKKVLLLGKVFRDASASPIDVVRNRSTRQELQIAALQFIIDHADEDVRCITDAALWEQNLDGFERVDEDYGFRHPLGRKLAD